MALPDVAQKLQKNRKTWLNITGHEYHQIQAEQQQHYAYLIYEHLHAPIVALYLNQRYAHAWKALSQFVAPVLNPLKKVANLKAQTYSKPPIRRGNNTEIRKLLAASNARINRKLDYACRLLEATGNVLIWPTVGSAPDAPIALDLQVFAPHEVHLVANHVSHTYDIAAVLDEYIFCYWHKGRSRNLKIYDMAGKPTQLYAAIGRPVWCSLVETKFGRPRCTGPVNDLISGTLSVNQMETFAERVSYLKSFKQPVSLTDERIKTDNFIAGPDNVWPESIELVDLVDHNDFFEKMIEGKVTQLCNQHGISEMLARGDFSTGVSWESVSEELVFHFESQIENWQYIESQIWSSVVEIADLELPADSQVAVKFTPPYRSSRDPDKEHDLHRKRVSAGYDSTVERYMEENPHLSDPDKAREEWKARLAEFAEEVNLKRDLNISDSGPSPAENGANGAAAKFGEVGRNGPSVSAPEEVQMIKDKEALK